MGTAIGLDLTGQTEAFSAAASMGSEDVASGLTVALDQTSGAAGTAYGTTQSTAIFAGYNIWDDLLLNDAAGGLTAQTAGVLGGYYGYKKVLKPTAIILDEGKDRKAIQAPHAEASL